MNFCYMYLLRIILYCTSYQIVAKASREEIFPSGNSKLQCSTGQDLAQTQPDSYDIQPHFKQGEKYAVEPNQFAEKRSINEIFSSKKQVGVIYKNDYPIGILQPAQRSYRFIPVGEEDSLGFDKLQGGKALADNVPAIREIKKRQIEGIHHYDNYPSILTNFKIGNKLDQKRNQEVAPDTFNNLKSGIRQMRSSKIENTEHFDDELKNVLDDMGLINENENHPEKREIADSDTEVEDEDDEEISKLKNKRNKDCIEAPVEQNEQLHLNRNHVTEIMDASELKHQNLVEKRDEMHDVSRYKQDVLSGANNYNFEDPEELSDFDNFPLNEHKSFPNRNARDIENDANEKSTDYDKKIEHQIQTKIDALKEEVKREINLVKEEQNEDDTQRKKRQIPNNLIDEETEDIDPALNSDTDLKMQIRKRRATSDVFDKTKYPHLTRIIKRHFRNPHTVRKKRNLLKVENNGKISNLIEGQKHESDLNLKLNTFTNLEGSFENTLSNQKAALSSSHEDINKHHDEIKRVDGNNDINTKSKFLDDVKHNSLSQRFRRRINEKGKGFDRPQQLSDMSGLDIFGGLPKSYEGVLSRYKRVKRK